MSNENFDDNIAPQDIDDQLTIENTLIDPELDDALDRGFTVPDYEPAAGRNEHETLDERLAEEMPDDQDNADIDDLMDGDLEDGQVGGERAGRLTFTDPEHGEDTHDDVFARDVGVDGAAASAEEAAMHVIDTDEDNDEVE